jgi:hypothetical protein
MQWAAGGSALLLLQHVDGFALAGADNVMSFGESC